MAEQPPADPIELASTGLTQAKIELLQLEYGKCCQRYEDIYKAIWTNFSYMALVAGAVLTFTRLQFHVDVSALLACLPLLFWYWATFEPLNKYGDKVVERISELEKALNVYVFQLAPGCKVPESEEGLKHFTDFNERMENQEQQTLSLLTALLMLLVGSFLTLAWTYLDVSHVILVIATVSLIVSSALLIGAFRGWSALNILCISKGEIIDRLKKAGAIILLVACSIGTLQILHILRGGSHWYVGVGVMTVNLIGLAYALLQRRVRTTIRIFAFLLNVTAVILCSRLLILNLPPIAAHVK